MRVPSLLRIDFPRTAYLAAAPQPGGRGAWGARTKHGAGGPRYIPYRGTGVYHTMVVRIVGHSPYRLYDSES